MKVPREIETIIIPFILWVKTSETLRKKKRNERRNVLLIDVGARDEDDALRTNGTWL